jgi:AbrB family looped-hinge helix DNA binding protein
MKNTIDRAARVLIPKAIRDAVGLIPGSPVQIAHQDGKVVIELKSPKMRLVRKGGLLVATIPGAPKMSVEKTNEWIRKSRDRRI